jgi:hypothetical protein
MQRQDGGGAIPLKAPPAGYCVRNGKSLESDGRALFGRACLVASEFF